MTVEHLVELMKEYLQHSSGLDYYDYCSGEHWWGDEEQLRSLAVDIQERLL